MIASEFEERMDFFGRVRLWHPGQKKSYHVLEMKIGEDGEFVALEHGVYVFFVSPDLTRAERTTTRSAAETAALVAGLMAKGWLPLGEDADVPKLNEWIEWQACPKIRSVLPQ